MANRIRTVEMIRCIIGLFALVFDFAQAQILKKLWRNHCRKIILQSNRCLSRREDTEPRDTTVLSLDKRCHLCLQC